MARRKIEDRYIRSLTKVSGGKSYAVTLPVEYIRKLKWRCKQKLDVKLSQGRITISDWKPKLFACFSSMNGRENLPA
jgi:DNA primase